MGDDGTSRSWYSLTDLADEYYHHCFPSTTTRPSKKKKNTNDNEEIGETFLLVHGLIHLSEQMNQNLLV